MRPIQVKHVGRLMFFVIFFRSFIRLFFTWTYAFQVITTRIIENFQGPEAVEQSARGDEIN